VLTATVQDYDKIGRTYDYWQCTPHNWGNPAEGYCLVYDYYGSHSRLAHQSEALRLAES
jgi:hypothetical protein